jgi:ADP-heptose:LPS heptosyltransferase
MPFIPPENVITVDRKSLGRFVTGLLKALRRIRREKIDTAIDLEGLTRSSAIITYLSGAVNRVGYFNFTSEGPYRGRLFTHELNYGFQHHTWKAFLGMVRALNAAPGDVPALKVHIPDTDMQIPQFIPTATETENVRRILREMAGRDPHHPLLLLNPNCSDLLPLRRWADNRFIELAQRILDTIPEATVSITGAPDEKNEAEAMASQIGRPGRCFSMAGRTTLRELLALYCLSDVLVSNDSGPCHFAALTPIKVVALFGPETPLLYGPLSRNAVSISAGLACSPCVNMLNHRFSPCNDNKCMQAISVDQVFGKVREVLKG